MPFVKVDVMNVEFVVEFVLRGSEVLYVTHTDDDGYMEGGVYRDFSLSDNLDGARAIVDKLNGFIANGERLSIVGGGYPEVKFH